MARTETQLKKQKRKGKKRKHETPHGGGADSDDEVASKSLIVEPEQSPSPEEESPRKEKKNKRKLADGADKEVKEKRSKHSSPASDGAEVNMEEAGNDNYDEVEDMPTVEQLEEAAKPENSNAIVTVRQKKKLLHQQRVEAQKDQSVDKESKRNEEYLRKWKEQREEWKFVKLRQISIQTTIFDEDKLNADMWPVALEYLAGSMGAAKATITKLAEEVIQKLDKECEELELESERQAIIDSTRYQRARDLLQSFD